MLQDDGNIICKQYKNPRWGRGGQVRPLQVSEVGGNACFLRGSILAFRLRLEDGTQNGPVHPVFVARIRVWVYTSALSHLGHEGRTVGDLGKG